MGIINCNREMVNVLQKLFKLNLGASGGGLSQEEWTLAK